MAYVSLSRYIWGTKHHYEKMRHGLLEETSKTNITSKWAASQLFLVPFHYLKRRTTAKNYFWDIALQSFFRACTVDWIWNNRTDHIIFANGKEDLFVDFSFKSLK